MLTKDLTKLIWCDAKDMNKDQRESPSCVLVKDIEGVRIERKRVFSEVECRLCILDVFRPRVTALCATLCVSFETDNEGQNSTGGEYRSQCGAPRRQLVLLSEANRVAPIGFAGV